MSNAASVPQNPQLTPQLYKLNNPSGADILQIEVPGEGIVARWNQFQSPVYTATINPSSTVPASPCKDSLFLNTASGVVYLFDGTNWNSIGDISTVSPANTPAIAHEFFTAYNSTTGAFTQAQPAVTDLSGLGTGVATFLGTPTSANLAAAVTDETGSGSLVFGTGPTITLANGTGLPISTGVSGLATGVAAFLATPTSANLATAVTNETGSGALVFATSPTFVTPVLGTPSSGTLSSCTSTTQTALNNSTSLGTTAYSDRTAYLVTWAGFRDDFIGATANAAVTTATGFSSDTGWQTSQISAGTQTIATVDSTWANPGQAIFSTSATSGQGITIYKGSTHGSLGNLAAQAGWELNVVLLLGTTTSIAFRAGFAGTGQQAADAPTSGMWIRYDTASSDTLFTFESRSASTSTTSVTNSVAVNTSFNHFRIRSLVAGTILFSVNNGTETAISTNVPTTVQQPFFQLLTRTAGSQSATVDFFSYSAATSRT